MRGDELEVPWVTSNISFVWIVAMLDILQLQFGGTPAKGNINIPAAAAALLLLALDVQAREDVARGGGDGDDHLLRHSPLLQVPNEHSAHKYNQLIALIVPPTCCRRRVCLA